MYFVLLLTISAAFAAPEMRNDCCAPACDKGTPVECHRAPPTGDGCAPCPVCAVTYAECPCAPNVPCVDPMPHQCELTADQMQEKCPVPVCRENEAGCAK